MALLPGAASAQSLEDRLRTQLRETAQQLHQAQDSQSQLQAQLATAQQERDKAQADLKQAQTDLAKAKGRSAVDAATEHALAAERASHAQDSAQLTKYRADYETLLAQSRTSETTAKTRDEELKARDVTLQTCEAKNAQLYEVGHQILDAYEHVGMGTFLVSREPFAQASRVRYDEIAQKYGDQLYAGKFDPRARPVSASAPAAASQ